MIKNAVDHKANKHLLSAAKLLVEKIESPSILLTFLSDILYHYHEFSIENYNSRDKLDLLNEYNSILNLVEQLVIPWMNEDKDVLSSIAKGVYNLYDSAHYEGYYDTIGNILLAHSYSFKSGIPPIESQQRDLSIINTLSEIGAHIRYFEEEQQEKKAA